MSGLFDFAFIYIVSLLSALLLVRKALQIVDCKGLSTTSVIM